MRIPKVSALIPFIITALFLGVLYYIVSNKDVKISDEVVEDSKPFVLVDKSLITEKIYNEPTKYTTFDLSYPQFKNAPASFNKKIEDMVMNAMKDHAEISEQDWKARYATKYEGDNIGEFPTEDSRLSLFTNFRVVQANDKYISVLMSMGGYSGGAHGYRNMVSFNYDLSSDKEVKLSDLFPNDKNYLKKISEFSRQDLIKQFIAVESETGLIDFKKKEDKDAFMASISDMLNAGTEPIAENFNVFTFTSEVVELYFTEYQVAPYVMGSFSVSIPRK